jgi:mannitol-1-phosphate/altronate dehydrogenase
MTNQQACWTDADAASKVDCLCLGTGRFLRAVLIPALNKSNFASALIQTRGTSFFEYMQQQPVASYPVDTVTISGAVVSDDISCYGAFSLGFMEGEEATWKFVKSLSQTVKIIGVGVTEAGLASAETPAMKQLLELLRILSAKPQQQLGKICVINMDNVPDNGDLVQSYLDDLVAKDQELQCFVQNHVVCLNTMVDRITSSRPDSQGMIPRAEPLPAKALVILDPSHDLPTQFSSSSLEGVVIRSTRAHLEADLALKLRVANGTHTAVAHALALDKHLLTDHLAGKDEKLWMDDYLESLVNHQIIAAAAPLFGTKESLVCWKDWKRRLAHPHFGLSTFFITQNGAAKAGIRWGPTVCNLIKKEKPITVAMVFAYAVLLRWLVPQGRRNDQIFVGWLDGETVPTDMAEDREGVVSYADGLRYNLEAGWYEFKCACRVRDKSVSEWLKSLAGSQPTAYTGIIRDYLLEPSGGDLRSVESFPEFEAMVKAIATLVARMVQGDGIHKMMVEIQSQHGVFADGFASDCNVLVDGGNTNVRTLHYKASPIPADSHLLQTAVDTKGLGDVVFGEVASAQVVDLHTHLLPPSHGPLCLWGIDELLTYVSEIVYAAKSA